MTKKMFVKTDGRYKGHSHWQYFIPRPTRQLGRINYPTRYQSMQTFFEWRKWCWSTWGPSKELDHWLDDLITRSEATPVDQNPSWCWSSDTDLQRIYLRGDAELTLFLLKWS